MISHYYIFIDCKIRKQILDFLKKKKKAKPKTQSKVKEHFKHGSFPLHCCCNIESVWSFDISIFEKFLHIKDFKAVFL